MNASHSLLLQPTPNRSLDRLSLVGHKKSEMQAWINNLPLINAPETGKKLYQTLKEFSSLNIETDQRFELLEIIEPAVNTLIQTLSKHIVHQPVLASVQASKVGAFIQALHLQLATNYKTVAIETLQKLQGRVGLFNLGKSSARQQAAMAIQRAISQLDRILMESSLIYTVVPSQVWANLHTLYQEAVHQQLEDQLVPAPHCLHGGKSTIRNSYLRAVLMAGSQPHKLRQTDILLLHVHSERWASMLQVNAQRDGSLLVCNHDDLSPGYPHLRTTQPGSWYIHTHQLMGHLRALDNSASEIPTALIAHLQEVWQGNRERLFERRPCDQPLLLCLGLSGTHFFMSGETTFSNIIAKVEETREIANPAFVFALEDDSVEIESPEIWQLTDKKSYDPVSEQPTKANVNMPYPVCQTQAINRSPAGYGVCWRDTSPLDLKPGELIGICEARGQGWNVGLLHWVRQTPEETVEAGLEILSTQAKPCAICLRSKGKDRSQYLRGMLLPEVPTLQRPALLITPASSTFKVGSEIHICLHGSVVLARLIRQTLATSSISQFEFALVDTSPSPKAGEFSVGDDIAELWDQL